MWKNYQESPPDRFDLSAFEENAPGEEFDFSVELRSYLVNHSDKSLTPAADHAHLQFMFHINRFILNDDNRRAGWTRSAELPLTPGSCAGRKARVKKKKSV